MTSSDPVASELNKLFRQSGHYLAALVAGLALGFVSFPVFTRAFSVADYGLIDYVQKFVILLTAFAKLGIQNSALRFYDGREFSSDPAAARHYYSTIFLTVGLTAAVVTTMFMTAMFLVPHWLIDAPLASLLCFGGTLIFLRALESILWAFLRVEERTKTYSVISVAIRAGTIAVVCVLLLFGRSPRVYFAGTIAVEVLAVAGLTIWLFRRGLLDLAGFDWSLMRKSAVFGAPLVIYELSGIVLDSGDRFLIRHYLGARPLGLYSVAYGLSSYINEILITPINLALVPIYMRLWRTDGRGKTTDFLSSSLDIFLLAAAGIFAMACVLSRDGVLFLASSKYRGAEALMPMLVAGLLIYTCSAFLSAGLLIEGRTITMAKLLLAAAAINIGLNIVLLPRMGLEAAALATLISYGCSSLFFGLASFRTLPLTLNFQGMLKYALAAAVAGGLASRIELGAPLFNLAARGTTVVLVYIGILCAWDKRVRDFVHRLLLRIRQRSTAEQLIAHSSDQQELSLCESSTTIRASNRPHASPAHPLPD
ncbi:MAG: hypothetical protein NVS9B4_15830 [Candidatus Acidiferrum sp.]